MTEFGHMQYQSENHQNSKSIEAHFAQTSKQRKPSAAFGYSRSLDSNPAVTVVSDLDSECVDWIRTQFCFLDKMYSGVNSSLTAMDRDLEPDVQNLA